jgi:putative cell wall-binding protein
VRHEAAGFAALAASTARELAESPDAVIVTRDDNYPDALAASAVSAYTGWPILFTATGSLSGPTSEVIAELGVATVHIVGGPNAVSVAVAGELAKLAAVERHAGSGTIATALAIADLGVANGLVGTTIQLATARAFPDALAGGALAPQIAAAVLLTEPAGLSAEVREWLARHDEITSVILLGGNGALGEQVQIDLASIR